MMSLSYHQDLRRRGLELLEIIGVSAKAHPEVARTFDLTAIPDTQAPQLLTNKKRISFEKNSDYMVPVVSSPLAIALRARFVEVSEK